MDFSKYETDGILSQNIKKWEFEEPEVYSIGYETIKALNPKVIGNPEGDYEERLDFLKWLLETKNTRHAGSFMKTAVENFGNPITTQLLLNLIDNEEGVRRRINDLRNRIGYKTTPIGYRYKEYVNTKFKTAFTNFTEKKGNIYFNTRLCNVGRFRMVRRVKLFSKWIPNKEFKVMREGLKKLEEGITKRKEEKEFFKEITLNNLFNSEWRIMDEPEMTTQQYNALNKRREGQGKMFHTKCEYCSGIIKFPLTPNVESDKYEKLAHFIYNSCLNECEGIVLCKNCLDNRWIEVKILKMFNGLNKDKSYKFPLDKFCEHFRKDKKIVENEDIMMAIKNILKKEGTNRKIEISGNEIIVF